MLSVVAGPFGSYLNPDVRRRLSFIVEAMTREVLCECVSTWTAAPLLPHEAEVCVASLRQSRDLFWQEAASAMAARTDPGPVFNVIKSVLLLLWRANTSSSSSSSTRQILRSFFKCAESLTFSGKLYVFFNNRLRSIHRKDHVLTAMEHLIHNNGSVVVMSIDIYRNV